MLNGGNIFVPDEDDKQAARELINMIPHDQSFHMPLTRLYYRVDHHARTLTLVDRSILPEHEFSRVVHARLMVVFPAIGYKVL